LRLVQVILMPVGGLDASANPVGEYTA